MNKRRVTGRKGAFLAAVAIVPNISEAAISAKVDRRQHYRWMAEDPEYRAMFESAWEEGIDTLEAEAVRRAFKGVEEPVFSGGRRALDVVRNGDGSIKLNPDTGKPLAVPASIVRKSDTLLMFFLNGNRSRKYRNRTDSRFVDKDGDDRQLLDVASVRAYMQAAPRDGESS